MKRAALAMLVLVLVAACGTDPAAEDAPGARLERAAIATGTIPDPAASDPSGAYGRDADRLCITGSGDDRRVGIYAYYGDDLACTARGTVRGDGETLTMALGGDGRCVLEARFDGDTIALPGAVPAGCARFCDAPASLAGLGVARLSTSVSEAETMRGADNAPLCPPD